MNHPDAILPNDAYYGGLRDADPAILLALYEEFRRPIIRAVEAAGGSQADGATFFRVAVFQTAELTKRPDFQQDVPIYYFLKNLAVAQYRDWLTEREQEIPEREPMSEEPDLSAAMPDTAQMRQMRQRIRARRHFNRLDAGCQQALQALAEKTKANAQEQGQATEKVEFEPPDNCVENYKSLLAEDGNNWEFVTAEWTAALLNDAHFNKMWNSAERLESRLAAGQPLAEQTLPKSNVTRNVLIVLGLLLIASLVWRYFFRSKTPEEVYADNFAPPTSIVEDMSTRNAQDSVAMQYPEACQAVFEEADGFYKQKSWREALGVLATIIEEDSLPLCHSDALFYIGLMGLQMEEPSLTLECFSKIEDIERFGEDIYWYQALAFVQMAAQNPLQRDLARRAVERARSNTEIPERREQAEKMLEQLEE